MEQILFVCGLIVTVIGILYMSRTVYTAAGLFATKKYAPARKKHTFGIVIAARNEEAVIGNLIESIHKQDYPEELVKIFVVADNCTDNTAAVAREMGAFCYERDDREHATKGYALQYLFGRIEEEHGVKSLDAYLIFDADNLLKGDYISRINDAFDSGERLVTSYRNTKNFDDGWLSAGYALHWLRTVRFDNRGRSALGLSSWIQGCGFLIASELLADGWNYVTFAEDRSLSSDAVSRGIFVGYQHEAQFYDEQPTSLSIAWRQRTRWAKGHLQALGESGKALIFGIFRRENAKKRFMCYEMLMMNVPLPLVTLPVKLTEAGVVICAFCLNSLFGWQTWVTLLLTLFEVLIAEHLATIPMAWVVFFMERRRIPPMRWYKKLWYSLMFPMFSIIGDLATWVAVFTKVTWKPIPHKASMKIEEMKVS